METPLFAALLVGASLALFVKGERRWWVVASWLTVVALARPEGYLLCIFYGLSRLPWRELKPWVSVNGWARIISDQAGAILATAVVLAFFIVKAHYYDGVWFSQAYWLKKVGIYYQPRAFYMAASLVVRCGVVFAIAAWWLLCGLVRGEVLWVYALAAVYAVLCVIGPFEELIRYLMPVTALVSLLVVDGAARYGDSAKDVVLGRGSRRRAQILMMLALIVQGAATTVWFRNGHIMVADIQRCRIEVGHWLRNHAQPGDLILSTDVGGLGYASWPTQIVDIFGLTSRWPYDAIMSGRSFDEALAGRTAVFIADTFRKPESEDQQARVLPIYFANGAFIVARPESRLRWEIGAALKVCRQSRVPDVSIEVRPVRL